MSRLYNQKAQKHGITTAAAFVLLNISSSEGTPATKIAPTIGLETRSLTRMLKTLEEKKYIYRKRDLNDGRSVRIYLTELGMEKKGKAIETVKAFNQFIKQQIPEKKLNSFIEVSGNIIDLVEHNLQLKNIINWESSDSTDKK